MSSAAAAAAEMDAHKEEIRGTMTLTQHILLTQREHPVRPVVFCVEPQISADSHHFPTGSHRPVDHPVDRNCTFRVCMEEGRI
jgi:hypothetical protein